MPYLPKRPTPLNDRLYAASLRAPAPSPEPTGPLQRLLAMLADARLRIR